MFAIIFKNMKNKLIFGLLIGLFLLLNIHNVYAQTTATFGESGSETYSNTNTDTYIRNSAQTTNYGSEAGLYIMSNGDWKALVKFDVSQIPSNATVTSATLNLYINAVYGSPGTVSFYRLLRNWVENITTWNIYDTGASWSTAGTGSGTDYVSTAVLIQDPGVALGVKTFDLTSQVQSWVSVSQSNYGLLLTNSIATTYYNFSSSENTMTSQRPKLTVTYTVPAGDTTPPVLSNGSPTGSLASGTTQATLSLTTNESATCRYSVSAGVSYTSMTNAFSTTGGTNHSTTVTGLSSGNSYNYYVRCQDTASNANTSDYSISFSVASAGDTQTPTVPTNLSATAISSSQINLSWTASTDNVGVTGYRIYRGGTQVGTSATNSYFDTGLSPSTSYSYTVSAYDAAGNVSGQSSSASATTQSASAGSAQLSWNVNTESDLAGYRVYYGVSPRSVSISCPSQGGYANNINVNNVTNYTISNLTSGQTYYFAITAYDTSNNESCYSAEVSKTIGAASDTQTPTVPTNLSATAVSSSQINLSWTVSTDNVGVA